MPRILLLAALLGSAPAVASPLNTFGAEAGDHVFALTPYLYYYRTPDLHPYVYGQYGFTDRLELAAAVGATTLQGFAVDDLELMPRYFFTPQTAAALHLRYVPGERDLVVAPEWHGVYPAGPLTLTVNAGWGPSLGASGFSPGSLYAFVVPEWSFGKASSVFLEIDPTLDLNSREAGDDSSRLALVAVPGVSTAIADRHYFALGLGLPVWRWSAQDIYVGAWYSIAFGG